MEEKLKNIHQSFLSTVEKATTLPQLDRIFLSLFGKKGEITLIPKEFPYLAKEDLRKITPLFNRVKSELEQVIEKRRTEIREEGYKKLNEEKTDLTQPIEIKPRSGHLHPITKFEHEVVKLLKKLGFAQFDAPHIDNEEYNFELLNIPQDHPARDLWDTFYLDTKNLSISPGKLLLRTHTSNAQIRMMKENKLPLRLMNIGRCFRYENLDARHEHTFEQFELVYIDKGVNMANLQYLSEAVFGQDTIVRLRPKYYPFVEPGAGVDGLCIFCQGRGCQVCGGVGWLELAGAGMIHPQVLKNGGINPHIYSGIAWGFGLARMVMLKYGIEDIRLFNSGDLKFLTHFSNPDVST